ncbi:hypothetical protein AB0395_44820 [Streptosporangium sp. NPDC051023]|uniref:hypothetical protein n=1 Tax=Streptosporangium sp. NPDC051023 TaxID=3155410 RepID=UPI00344F31E5
MTGLLPGDVVSDDRGHFWWVHGNTQLGLYVTSASGALLTPEGVADLYGPITLTYRTSQEDGEAEIRHNR